MTPIVLLPFVKDLMLGSRIEVLAVEGFRIQRPDWENPAAGIPATNIGGSLPDRQAGASGGDPQNMVIIIDCNLASPDPAELISVCRAAYPRLPIVGFVSHVDTDSKRLVEESGATAVYPRSKFFSQTAQIVRRHLAAQTGERRDDSV